MKIYVSTKKDGNMSAAFSEDGISNRIKFLKSNNLDKNIYLNAVNKNIIFDSNIEHKYLRNDNTNCTYVNADAFITKDDTFIYCLFGDCVPMLIYDRNKKLLSLIHLGWKSVESNLHLKVLNYLHDTYNCNFNDLDIYIGPCIKKESYVIPKQNDIKQLNTEQWKKYIFDNKDTYNIDLVGYIVDCLKQMNISNINIDNTDTYTSDLYFSHHKSWMENIQDGRFIYGGRIERG